MLADRCEEVLSALGVAENGEVFAADWDRRMHGMPAGPLPFLTPAYVAWACREAFLSDDIAAAVAAAARRVAADDALQALAWYCHASLFGPEATEGGRRKAEGGRRSSNDRSLSDSA